MWFIIDGGEVCFESYNCLGSVTVAGTGRDSMFAGLRSPELSAQVRPSNSSTYFSQGHVEGVPMAPWPNFLCCVEDGGRDVCSPGVHHLVQNIVSATQMQFTHATRSSRARQIAGRVVR